MAGTLKHPHHNIIWCITIQCNIAQCKTIQQPRDSKPPPALFCCWRLRKLPGGSTLGNCKAVCGEIHNGPIVRGTMHLCVFNSRMRFTNESQMGMQEGGVTHIYSILYCIIQFIVLIRRSGAFPGIVQIYNITILQCYSYAITHRFPV